MGFVLSACLAVVLASPATAASSRHDEDTGSPVFLLQLIASTAIVLAIAFTLFGCCWYTKMRERSLERVQQQYEVFADVMANRMAQQQEDQLQQQGENMPAEGEGGGTPGGRGPAPQAMPQRGGGGKMDKKEMFQAMMEAKHAKQAQKKYGYTRVSNTSAKATVDKPLPNSSEGDVQDEDSDDGATESTPFPV